MNDIRKGQVDLLTMTRQRPELISKTAPILISAIASGIDDVSHIFHSLILGVDVLFWVHSALRLTLAISSVLIVCEMCLDTSKKHSHKLGLPHLFKEGLFDVSQRTSSRF